MTTVTTVSFQCIIVLYSISLFVPPPFSSLTCGRFHRGRHLVLSHNSLYASDIHFFLLGVPRWRTWHRKGGGCQDTHCNIVQDNLFSFCKI